MLCNTKEKIKFPNLIALDITYKCNLRCRHCFNSSGEQNIGCKELSDEEIMQIVNDVIKINPEVICICGGETLLRKELVYNVARKITSETNGSTKVNIVTNGHLITEDIAENLKKSGISFVQVSLDGSNEESYDWLRNEKGGFKKAVSAIKILRKVGIDVLVSCTPNKRNIEEYENVMKLCEELGVYEFRAQPLMLLGRAKEELKDYIPTNRDYIKVKKCMNKNSKSMNLKMQWGDPIEHLARANNGCNVENFTFNIDAYGYLIISPYLPIRVGHVSKASLITYWEKGYKDIWNMKFVREACKLIKSANEMELNTIDKRIPRNFTDKPITIDILDYENIKDMTLEDIILIYEKQMCEV